MKIFIYHNLIDNAVIRQHNQALAQINNLGRHLDYLEDFYTLFKKYETKDPAAADYFFVPLFLVGWKLANHDPASFIETFCAHRHRGQHIIVATGGLDAGASPYPWLDDRFLLLTLDPASASRPQDLAFLPYASGAVSAQAVERDIALSTSAGADDAVLSRSVFTLFPPGQDPAPVGLVAALRHGSIPVIVSDDPALPLADRINWSQLCLILRAQNAGAIETVVGATPITEVLRRQTNIRTHRAVFERDFSLGAITEILSAKAAHKPALSFADAAIARMRAPIEMAIICVDVTNKCDLACSNCTRLLENQDAFWEMTPDNFRLALRSLREYRGMIAMLGGNPCMHSKFAELCQIFVEEVPNRLQRGLWTNNIFKHQAVIEETFGGFNLNPHNNARAIPKLREVYDNMVIKRKFYGGLYEGPSDHSPLLTAVKDLYGEEEMWEKISKCDINRDWSASITQNKGQLRAYFCEVAASFDLARNEDRGLPVVDNWWQRPLQEFSSQIKHFCPGCGVPARLKGHFDHEEIDTYTDTNRDLALKSATLKKRRIVHLADAGTNELGHRVTQYAQSSTERELAEPAADVVAVQGA